MQSVKECCDRATVVPFNAISKGRGADGLCRCTSRSPSYGAAHEAARGTKDLSVRHCRCGERSSPKEQRKALQDLSAAQSAAWRENAFPPCKQSEAEGRRAPPPHLRVGGTEDARDARGGGKRWGGGGV
jgi:hypothetical protein